MVINIGNFYQIYKLINLKPLNFKNGIWSLRIRPGFGMSMPNATSAFSIKVQPAIWNGVLRAIKEDINSFKFKNKCKWNFKLSRKWLKRKGKFTFNDDTQSSSFKRPFNVACWLVNAHCKPLVSLRKRWIVFLSEAILCGIDEIRSASLDYYMVISKIVKLIKTFNLITL